MAENTDQSFIRPNQFWRKLGLRANQTVVHLGSGAGFYLIPAAKIVGSKGSVIGVDVREDMLREVESRAQRAGLSDTITTIRADIEAKAIPKIPDQSADWVLVANILYQSDQDKILTEAKRIVKQSGAIIVVEWDTAATPFGPPAEMRLAKQDVIAKALEKELLAHKEFSPSPYHYGLLFTLSR